MILTPAAIAEALQKYARFSGRPYVASAVGQEKLNRGRRRLRVPSRRASAAPRGFRKACLRGRRGGHCWRSDLRDYHKRTRDDEPAIVARIWCTRSGFRRMMSRLQCDSYPQIPAGAFARAIAR